MATIDVLYNLIPYAEHSPDYQELEKQFNTLLGFDRKTENVLALFISYIAGLESLYTNKLPYNDLEKVSEKAVFNNILYHMLIVVVAGKIAKASENINNTQIVWNQIIDGKDVTFKIFNFNVALFNTDVYPSNYDFAFNFQISCRLTGGTSVTSFWMAAQFIQFNEKIFDNNDDIFSYPLSFSLYEGNNFASNDYTLAVRDFTIASLKNIFSNLGQLKQILSKI